MKTRTFDTIDSLEEAACALLADHFVRPKPGPHAVMLTGGRTPLALYRRMAATPPPVDDALHLLVSDERHVPADAAEHNFSHIAPLVAALGLPPSHVLRVHTDQDLDAAAAQYDRDLAALFDGGGGISLGILGLGSDGHLASLFEEDDLTRGAGRWALAVRRPTPPDRISVSRDLLTRVERLVFLVTGDEKAAVVEAVRHDPESVLAVRALRDAPAVELWFAPHSLPRQEA